MIDLPEKKYYTVAEYLEREKEAAHRSEYYNGQIFSMAGGTPVHNRITLNTAFAFQAALDGAKCTVYAMDLKLDLAASNDYVYPDIMVVCGPLEKAEERQDIIKNPSLIVEVLSPSTEGFDRGAKFEKYRTLPTLQTYLLIAQDRLAVDVFSRRKDRWSMQAFRGIEAMIHLPMCHLSVADIYKGVTFEKV